MQTTPNSINVDDFVDSYCPNWPPEAKTALVYAIADTAGYLWDEFFEPEAYIRRPTLIGRLSEIEEAHFKKFMARMPVDLYTPGKYVRYIRHALAPIAQHGGLPASFASQTDIEHLLDRAGLSEKNTRDSRSALRMLLKFRQAI